MNVETGYTCGVMDVIVKPCLKIMNKQIITTKRTLLCPLPCQWNHRGDSDTRGNRWDRKSKKLITYRIQITFVSRYADNKRCHCGRSVRGRGRSVFKTKTIERILDSGFDFKTNRFINRLTVITKHWGQHLKCIQNTWLYKKNKPPPRTEGRNKTWVRLDRGGGAPCVERGRTTAER